MDKTLDTSELSTRQTLILFVISMLVAGFAFVAMMTLLFAFNILHPWGWIIMIPFTLIALPFGMIKIMPWFARKMTGDRSHFNIGNFAEPQPHIDVDGDAHRQS